MNTYVWGYSVGPKVGLFNKEIFEHINHVQLWSTRTAFISLHILYKGRKRRLFLLQLELEEPLPVFRDVRQRPVDRNYTPRGLEGAPWYYTLVMEGRGAASGDGSGGGYQPPSTIHPLAVPRGLYLARKAAATWLTNAEIYELITSFKPVDTSQKFGPAVSRAVNPRKKYPPPSPQQPGTHTPPWPQPPHATARAHTGLRAR